MTRNTVAIMVVAIACGLAVCGLEVIYVASLRAPNTEMVAIVARTDFSEYVVIQDPKEHFEIKAIEKTTARAGLMPAADFDKLAGRLVKPGLRRGDEVTEKNVLVLNVASLKKEMRILPIPFTLGGGFWFVPETYVDVVLTVEGWSEVFVENVLVLAVDYCNQSSGPIRGTALVQLDPAQIAKVVDANKRGTVSLVMRPAER